MKKTLILILTSLLLAACGGSGSGGDTDNTPSTPPPSSLKDVNMQVGQPYTVYPGNRIIKNSSKSNVKIIHEDEKVFSTVFLIDGNASIIRNP